MRSRLFFRLLFYGLFYISLFTTQAQTSQTAIDSLESLIPNKDGRDRIDLLVELAELKKSVSVKEAQAYLDESWELLEGTDYPEGLLGVMIVDARINGQTSNFNRSDSLLNEAEVLAAQLKDTFSLADVYATKSFIYGRQNKIADAIEISFEGLDLLENFTYPERKQSLLNNIGTFLMISGDNEKAIERLKEALNHALENNLISDIGTNYLNLGTTYYNLNNYEKSNEYILLAQDFFRKSGFIRALGNTYNNLGLLRSKQGLWGNAKDLYDSAIFYRAQVGDSVGMSITMLNQAKVVFDNLSKTEGLVRTKEALSLAEKIEAKNVEEFGYSQISDFYMELDQVDSAFAYYKKATEKSSEIRALNDEKRISELIEALELEKKETEILRLSKEQELLSKRQSLLLAIAICFLLLALLVFIAYNARLRSLKSKKALAEERLHKELSLKEAQLKNEVARVEQQNQLITKFESKIRSLTEELGEGSSTKLAEMMNSVRRDSEIIPWQAFRLKFDEIHPEFIKGLASSFPKLTTQELDACILLKMHFSNKEIAHVLNISYDGARKIITRLYRKMNFDSAGAMRNYLLSQ